jgi:monomeric sarcosine oxidase
MVIYDLLNFPVLLCIIKTLKKRGAFFNAMQQLHTTIIGAGIIGLSTAYALLQQGIKVTLLEQMHIDHQQSSSRGLSRLLRFEYGNDELYTFMVHLSLQRWYILENASKQQLFTPTGLLSLGSEHDTEVQDSYRVLRNMGYTSDKLDQQECEKRYPQFKIDAYPHIVYNPRAGILHASTCLQTLKSLVLSLEGEIREHQQVTSIAHSRTAHPLRLYLQSGEVLTSDRCVIAAGPWVHSLLHVLHLPVHLTRQYLLYFSQLPEDLFSWPTFPCFMADDLYGFPLHHSYNNGEGQHWLKIASHAFGSDTMPGETSIVDQNVIEQVKQHIYKLLPMLQQAQLAYIEPCIYDVTPDQDFILDYMPGDRRIVVATGMSGHAFKFGPLLGEIIGNLVIERPSPIALDRFSLARFSKPHQLPKNSVA